MDYATLKKHGARKPLIADGTLSFGSHNYADGRWGSHLITITEVDDLMGKGFTLEISHKMAVHAAVYFAGSITHKEGGPPDRRTSSQQLRALADMIDSGVK